MTDIEVRAIATGHTEEGHPVGYYQGRKYDGDVFPIPEKIFSERWMEKIEKPKKRGPKPKAVEDGAE